MRFLILILSSAGVSYLMIQAYHSHSLIQEIDRDILVLQTQHAMAANTDTLGIFLRDTLDLFLNDGRGKSAVLDHHGKQWSREMLIAHAQTFRQNAESARNWQFGSGALCLLTLLFSLPTREKTAETARSESETPEALVKGDGP